MDMFTLRLFLVLGIFIVTMYLAGRIARRVLKVKKKTHFFIQYVNRKHRIIDWVIRAVLLAGFLVLAGLSNASTMHAERWFTFLLSFLLILNVLTELLRAGMEKKYDEDRNQYLVTLIELMVSTVFVIVIIWTSFFGWLF